MTAMDIADNILDVVQEPAFDEDTVVGLLNECAQVISRRFILPALDAENTVTAVNSASSVALPTDFQRNLYFCKDDTSYNEIAICNSKDQVARYYDPNMSNSATLIRGVAAVGPLLYYAPMPINDTVLTLRYQKVQAVITLATELDEYILPYGFQDLWKNYAIWKLFSRIEQGMEGRKVDTSYYMSLFVGLLDELSLTLRKEGVSMPPPPVASMERW